MIAAWIASAAFLLLGIAFSRTTDTLWLRALAHLPQSTRRVPARLALPITSCSVLALAWGLDRANVDREAVRTFLVLGLYVPAQYVLFCDVTIVGPRREALFGVLFLFSLTTSLALWERLELLWILGLCVTTAFLLVRAARRDASTWFLRSLGEFTFHRDRARALVSVRRSLELDPSVRAAWVWRDFLIAELEGGPKPSPEERTLLLADPRVRVLSSALAKVILLTDDESKGTPGT